MNIGNAECRLIIWAFFNKDQKATFNKIVGPVQNGVGTQAGISITAFGVTAALDAAPEFDVIQGDLKNGYNEICRESITCALQEAEKFGGILMFVLEEEVPTSSASWSGTLTSLLNTPLRSRLRLP